MERNYFTVTLCIPVWRERGGLIQEHHWLYYRSPDGAAENDIIAAVYLIVTTADTFFLLL